jgi:hypothetical protein
MIIIDTITPRCSAKLIARKSKVNNINYNYLSQCKQTPDGIRVKQIRNLANVCRDEVKRLLVMGCGGGRGNEGGRSKNNRLFMKDTGFNLN